MLGPNSNSGIEEDVVHAMIKINEARQVVSTMGVVGGSNAQMIMQSANYELDNFQLKLRLAKSKSDVQEIISQVERKKKSYSDSMGKLAQLHMNSMLIKAFNPKI